MDNASPKKNPFDKLKDNQEQILLLEITAWLHDMGKCTDAHIINQAMDKDKAKKHNNNNNNNKIALDLIPNNPEINILSAKLFFKDLIRISNKKRRGNLIYEYSSRCHRAAHTEKEGNKSQQKQLSYDTRISSPFGFEGEHIEGLTNKLKRLPWGKLSGKPEDRKIFLKKLKEAFLNALGDTRRPINEITLYDWSFIVAALFKSAVAGALLNDPSNINPDDLKWRLLSVRFDGMDFWGRVSKIPDLIARKKILNDSLDKVKNLIEIQYPLGLEVYRDQNGSVFVVPGIDNILELKNNNSESLKDMILKEFASKNIDKELIPIIKIDEKPWRAQLPKKKEEKEYTNEPPPISDHLKDVITNCDPELLKEKWGNGNNILGICPVCGLRPQGPSQKAKERKVCEVCEKRREERSNEWLNNLNTTIWNDEITDINGRLALITGKFDLSHWNKKDGYIKTLLFANPENNNENKTKDDKPEIKKTQSFARMRRIWETTKKFWNEISNDFKNSIGKISPRLRINIDIDKYFGYGHAYELAINKNTFITVIYYKKSFIIADNLQYIAKLMGANKNESSTYCASAMFVKSELEKIIDKDIKIITPGEYGKPKKEKKYNAKIKEVIPEPSKYIPTIPILNEPEIFMAMVPANKALKIAHEIKEKYKKELGKVQNRLPISVGLVFFNRRTTLAAAIDAGKRMLKMNTNLQKYKIKEIEPYFDKADDKKWPNEIDITLKKESKEYEMPPIKVPIKMGDRKTTDYWYPYWNIDKKTDRNFTFTRKVKSKEEEEWIHVTQLEKDDEVNIHPSLFDFEYLDTASRRFEISYSNEGKRFEEEFRLPRPPKSRRPYYLNELDIMENIWKIISTRLSKNQIYQVIGLIEEKRAFWKPEKKDETFKDFIKWTLLNANWIENKKPSNDSIDILIEAAQSGLLADVAELYLEILKEEEINE